MHPRARFRRAVDAGEKVLEAMLKAQANFEQVQQEVVQAHMDLNKLMQEAPLPEMPAPQVSVNLVKSLEALTGLVAGSTLDHQSHAESQGHRTGHTFATSMRAHSSRGKFLKFRFLSVCTVAWLCSRARQGDTGRLALNRPVGTRARDR